MVDLNGSLSFVMVARHGGFSAAGRVLGLPRSTISARVMSLEERLGVRLLRRSTRKVVLTEEGRSYLEAIEGAIDTLAGAEEAIDMRGELRGAIRITAPVEYPLPILSEAIASFRARHSAVSFEVLVTNRRLDLVAENIDMAIRGGDPGGPGLVASRLPDLPFGLFASPAYLAARGEPRKLDDLAGHAMLPLAGRDRRRLVGLPAELERSLLAGPTGPASDSMTFLRHLAVAGEGVAILPRSICRDDVAAGRLRLLAPHWDGHEMSAAYLVFPSRRDMTARVRAFAETLKQHAVAAA